MRKNKIFVTLGALLGLALPFSNANAAVLVNTSAINKNVPFFNEEKAPLCPLASELYKYITNIDEKEYSDIFAVSYKYQFEGHVWEGSHIWYKPVNREPNDNITYIQTGLADLYQGLPHRADFNNYMGWDVWVCWYKVLGAGQTQLTTHVNYNK